MEDELPAAMRHGSACMIGACSQVRHGSGCMRGACSQGRHGSGCMCGACPQSAVSLSAPLTGHSGSAERVIPAAMALRPMEDELPAAMRHGSGCMCGVCA